MEFKAEDIAKFLNGEVVGNPQVTVNNVSKIEEGKAGTLAFLANPKYESYIYESEASVILVNSDFYPKREVKATLIKVADAYQAFASLLTMYEQARANLRMGIEQPSFVHESAVTGEKIYVGAFAYISRNVRLGNRVKIYPQVFVGENVVIGDDTILYPGVKIYNDCKIGSRCIVHAGAVIGADGFGFAPQDDGSYRKIPQIGNVILEDDVEVGANTTIDCSTMGSTIIRKGVKLDNLIQIAHNCEVGENTVIAAQAGIAGSSKVGKNCRLGGQVGIAGHLTIRDNVQIGAQAGIMKDVQNGEILLGSPAVDLKQSMRISAILKNLPQLRHDLMELQRDMKKISAQKADE